ncbi:hypothetical protein ILYODFUR_034707, partial [Ilyodon furcidens]
GGPSGAWAHVSRSGLARPGPTRSNPATRRSPASPDPRPGSRNSGQQLETPSTAAARINRSTDEDNLYYTSVVFSKTQDEPLYSNFMPAEAKTPQEEEVDVEYSTVMIRGTSSISSHDASEESCAVYSTVSKVNGLQTTLHM